MVLRFSAAAQAQTTALFFQSQPGDWVGQGATSTHTLPDGIFTIAQNYDHGVSVAVRSADYSFWWYLDFSAAGKVPLTTGSYNAAKRYPFTDGNGLSFSGSGRGCNMLTGRYEVLELVLASDGSVSRFAADFEQHCEDSNPGLYGAIRYNSTISTLNPFQGNYPRYELTITPHARGRVTGVGIECGAGSSTCQTALMAPASVLLTAVADAGYVFAGWAGDCEGAAATTVRVNGPKICLALFEPLIPSSPRTFLLLDSQPGDYIGGGLRTVKSSANSTWTLYTSSDRNRLEVVVDSGTDYMRATFSAPQGMPLTPGYYGAAQRSPFARFNGLDVSVRSNGCNELSGRFVILDLGVSPDGTVERFAADFEQHCEGNDPALFGVIRYNSMALGVVPFGGDYPSYQLTLTPPVHGRVTGGGMDCGTGGTICEIEVTSPTTVTLTASPDFGYVFTGWASDCQGTATTAVRLNSAKTCAALFEPAILTTPAARTLLYWDSQPGDYIGLGVDHLYSASNSAWTVTLSDDRGHVGLKVDSTTDNWYIDFSAPQGMALAPGYYSAARRYPFARFNGLDASGSGRGCNQLTGRFVILELVTGPNNTVQRFAADFEQHCEDNDPALFGAIRYNSTISEILPFGGAYPSYGLTVAVPGHGRVTAQGVNCGGSGVSCELGSPTPTYLTLTATPDFGYIFTGWTEDCSGGATTTLHMNGSKRCTAGFEPAAAVAPRTLLRVNRQSDDGLPEGWSEVFSPINSVWRATRLGNGSGVSVSLDSVGPDFGTYWSLDFEAPTGELLQAGRTYTGAARFPSAGVPALEVSGNSSSCSGSGEFTILELVWGSQDTVVRFAADFTLTCSSTGPTLVGSLQYNSTIDVPSTTMTVEPAVLRFAALHNRASVITQPTPQTLRLTLARADVGWTASPSQPWIQITPSAGTGSAVITIAPNLLGGHPGTGNANGAITITLTDGTGTTETISLSVTLHWAGTTQSPFGFIDTPLPDRTGVTGAIPITGWALDDIEVSEVTICRAAVAGEGAPVDAKCGGAAEIYVGSAVFVEGARPDVQMAYSTYPRNDAAGWGFLLLTNTLPNQGNGTFVFSAYARDREGFVFRLGTRTMTCDNAHATAPFGTIDTPLQGETVSGSSYVNFGWALTQNPKSLPIDGSTLMVYVDGVPVGNPSYNHHRPDVATLFPGLANSNGAVGFKIIDTATLSNGLHTIVWTATDSAGATSGLGSRFFRVLNGVGSVTAAATANTTELSSESLATLPLDASPVIARRGWSADTEWRLYPVGRSARAVLRGEEIDRFELTLGAENGETYSGYLRVGGQLRPPPVGSRLDAKSGAFTWSPGVGFVGTYDVVFVRSNSQGPLARREVRFILQPKGNGHVGTQAVIDTPRPQQDVAQPFALGGWAVDVDAATGTGIDSLHVWAYPLTGGAPVFLGAARYGGTRPDVAAVHGDQFVDSGFGLVVQGLTPGNYDLAVFPWSNVSGGFTPPQMVHLTVR